MNRILLLALSLFLVWNVNTYADAKTKSQIKIENLRVILAPRVASSTAAYGEIKNTGSDADTLINIESNVGRVMLHQTKITSGTAQMNHIEAYTIEAGESLVLKPMSYHLMFIQIDHNIVKKNGEATLTLTFEKAGKINITVPVVSN